MSIWSVFIQSSHDGNHHISPRIGIKFLIICWFCIWNSNNSYIKTKYLSGVEGCDIIYSFIDNCIIDIYIRKAYIVKDVVDHILHFEIYYLSIHEESRFNTILKPIICYIICCRKILQGGLWDDHDWNF